MSLRPVLPLLFTLAACASQPKTPPPLSRTTHARIIAHRGGALEAPENTLAAIHHARSVSDWIEVDLHLSQDGVPVVIHDATLDRTTGTPGRVADLPAATLTTLPVGQPRLAPDVMARLRAENALLPSFGDRYQHERLPTLADLLAIPDVRYMLELKSTSAATRERLVQAVVDTIHAHDAGSRVAIASFDVAILEHARRLAPAIPRIGLVDHPSQLSPMQAVDVDVLATWHGLAKDALALRAGASSPAIWVWTIYSEGRARDLDALGVDGLITDAPTAVRRALATPATPGS